MTSTGSAPSANADWVRGLQRTAEISPGSTRTLAVAIAENAAEHGARPVFLGEQASLTYAELADRVDHYARWARGQGLRKGDRIALMLENQPDYPAIWIGLVKAGVVAALLNTQLTGEGLAHCITVSGSRHMIVDAAHVALVTALGIDAAIWVHGADYADLPRIDTYEGQGAGTSDEDVRLSDPALLIYTSGTTGLPKAAHISHYRIMMWSEWFAGIMDVRPDDRLYNCLPMYHSVGGVVAIGSMLVAGASVVVRKGFSVRAFWPDVAASGATIFQYIGELCRYLVAGPSSHNDHAHKLRLCVGNGLRADVWEAFAERFAIPRIIEFYAATEGSFSLFNLEGRDGAIGRIPRFMSHRSPVALVAFDHGAQAPLRDGEGHCRRCAAGEAGEAIGMIATEPSGLATRFEGYTSEKETERKVLRNVFAEGDAWFRTGDLMRQDRAGFFYFVDRIGDTFRWKGENVSAAEVADVIASCPGVMEAAVYGVVMPGADGRAGMAAIVPEPSFDLARLHAHLAERLPKYARPVFLRLRAGMDVTSTFKTKKQDLVEDGFDPRRIGDQLFLDDPEEGTFRPLDAAGHARIMSGTVRL